MQNRLYILSAFFVLATAHAASPVRNLLQENRLDEALVLCRQFEVLSTNDNDNFLACAWVYFRTDRVDSAEKLMDKMKRSFSLPEYQLLLAEGKIKRKQFEEAKKILSSITGEYKGSSIGLTAQELSAEVYENLGQLDTAAFIYKQVVGDDSKRARAQWGLGRYYLARGDNRRAIEHLETTTRLWPKHMSSRFNLGVLYLSQDNLPDAAKWLGECYKLDRSDTGVIEHLGLLFEKKGMIAEAIKHWQKAIELKKNSPLAKEKLAKYFTVTIDNLIEQKKYGQALAQIETSGVPVTSQPKLMAKRGLIYRALGRYEKAAGDLKAYLNTEPNDPTAARELGICYVNLNLVDSAKVYFARATAAEPTNGFNHAWLAYVLETKGDLARARDEWQKAVELFRDPVEVEKATRRLAFIDKKLGKDKKKTLKRKKKEFIEMDAGAEAPQDDSSD